LCVDVYAIVDHPVFMITSVIGWIKYCIVIFMHEMWITLNSQIYR